MRHAAGFTLLEVLVAAFVLALGLVGATAMQLHAMRTRHESALLSASLRIATAMADRVRANAGQIPAVYLAVDYDAHGGPAPAAPAHLCLADPCDAAQIARLDVYELERQVRVMLPAGRARICRDAQLYEAGRLRWACSGGAADPVVVKIGWRGRRPDGSPADDAAPGVAVALAGLAP